MTYYELIEKENKVLEKFDNLTNEQKIEYLTLYEEKKMNKGKILFSLISFFPFNIFQKKITKSTIHYVLSLISFILILIICSFIFLLIMSAILSIYVILFLILGLLIFTMYILIFFRIATLIYTIIKADIIIKYSDLNIKEEVFCQLFGNEEI